MVVSVICMVNRVGCIWLMLVMILGVVMVLVIEKLDFVVISGLIVVMVVVNIGLVVSRLVFMFVYCEFCLENI